VATPILGILASVPAGSKDDELALIDELARVFTHPEDARLLLGRVGYPPSHVPQFKTALVFWTGVMEMVKNGVIPGGVQAVIREAAKQYPANRFFLRRAEPPTSELVEELAKVVSDPSEAQVVLLRAGFPVVVAPRAGRADAQVQGFAGRDRACADDNPVEAG
jgi:hypothetical protein